MAENLAEARVLDYGELRSMAVAPAEPGAYSDSPVSSRVGLHVHASDPYNIHVVVDGRKIAEVHPHRTDILLPGGDLPADLRIFRNLLPDPWYPGW